MPHSHLAAPYFKNVQSLEILRDKTILVTGLSGWIGKWIIEGVEYLNSTHKFNTKIVGITRSIERFAAEFPKAKKISELQLIELDLKSDTLKKYVTRKIDYIININI